jgi:6-phosphogluconate dehydrogenase
MRQMDVGLFGLAVMGQNLALNIERHGYEVSVYNRTQARMDEFIKGSAKRKDIQPTYSIEEFAGSLKRPRRVILMVKAGRTVDEVIAQLKPSLQAGDVVVDAGNSHYKDSERREAALMEDGIQFLGVGISGGEEGALWGPSIMPGGERKAYDLMESIFHDIAAQMNGEPCVAYLGPGGAGHYVKMVHNGIEYGNMQLIAEAYDLLRSGLEMSARELRQIFEIWNEGEMGSYLVEITADIFSREDVNSGSALIDMILDKAEQKGTGRWTSQEALELGLPIPTITAAVEARSLSARLEERKLASELFPRSEKKYEGERRAFIEAVETALFISQIFSYSQGMELLAAASREHGYGLDLSEIARIWRAGCIIRAKLLEDIREAFTQDPQLSSLILAPYFREAIHSKQGRWRKALQAAVQLGIPIPAMSASLAAFDAYRRERLPANLIQAQRDYFGAHTYERVDREGSFHTDWKSN